MGNFLVAQGQLTPQALQLTPQALVESGRNFELFREIIVLLVTCKYEEDPIKNEGARVLTRLYDVFQPLKGNLL